jgi:predicted metal-dependent enzyme (double-stranded beta helix superfamily)
VSREAARLSRILHAVADVFSVQPDVGRATELASPMIGDILAIADLPSYGVPRRPARKTADTESIITRWLFYDSQLGMLTLHYPEPEVVPAHDHGTWELVAVIDGSIDYRSYCRTDNGGVAGHADLEVVVERKMQRGDIAVIDRPPADIHAWEVTQSETLMFGIVGPGVARVRRYFDTSAGTFVER